MGFKEDLQRLSVQVSERKVHIVNEEMTKQALIIPFVQILGFDVFNPLEVSPEYVADFGKKKGEKVDYALFKDNTPIVFVEAKSVNEDLSNHDAQLSRYFNAVPEVKLGILTNGIEYKFFTDLDENNIMDDKPFLTINIINLKDSDIENLIKFKKDTFDTSNLVNYAEELVYTSALNENLKELFKNPSDEFIRFIIKDYTSTRITNNVIERFKPLVKKAISNAVLDIVSKGLYQSTDEKIEQPIEECINAACTEVASTDENKKKTTNTTEEELKLFEIIKNILSKDNKDIDNISYKDTTSYFSINYKNINGWFIRINLDATNKNVITRLDVKLVESLCKDFKVEQAPKGYGESRVYINSYEDISNLEGLIIACYEDIVIK